MNPSFNDITYFIEVTETKNITRASERLGITQPSLSAALQRLEHAVGARLLLRSRSGVELTKAGKEFIWRARGLLSTWEQIKSDTTKHDQMVSGQYSLGCHPSVALYSLGKLLPGLLQDYPSLEIRLHHDLSRKIAERVISYEIDFGIVVNPVRHPDLVIRPLCRDEVCFWTAKKISKTQDTTSGEAVLICDMNLNQAQVILGELKKQKVFFKRIIQTSSLEVVTDLVEKGAGIGILPARVVERLAPKTLEPLRGHWPVFHDQICLIYRKDAQTTKGSSVIIESIKKIF